MTNPIIKLQPPIVTLPDLITAISKVKGGYMVYDGTSWTYFLERDLMPEQVEDLEDWRLELHPDRKRVA